MKNVLFLDVLSCDSYKTDFSEEHINPIVRVERISELKTMLGITSN
jgi:hypothetical protein